MFLDQFFRVTDKVKLPDGRTAVVRTLSDSEIQARSEYAIVQQLAIQDGLRDTNSDIYRSKVEPLLEAPSEDIIDALAEMRRGDLVREATEQIVMDFYPYPDDATEQEKIDTAARQRDHETNVYTARAKYVSDNETAYRDKLAALPRDTLVANIKATVVRIYTMRAEISAEVHYTISVAYEIDDKSIWTVEQVKKFPGSVLDRLMNEYQKVDRVDPWELTKSIEAGGSSGVESSS